MIHPESLQKAPSWSLPEKIVFRFLFIFFGLFIFPFPIGNIPHADQLFGWYYETWNWFVIKTGKYILHLSNEITIQPNGSGDTTWNYVQMFIILIAAATGCLVWSVLDRKRKDYQRLFYWFTVAVRYYLAFTLIAYGSYKVFKSQFPAPGIYRLTETYGESSPMGLAWTFLGFSKAYNYFMGFAEITGGLLLFFRKSATFGALFCMTVTLNILMINFCFDVPVKIFSTMLFLMAVYIAAPDTKRLLQFFLFSNTSRLKPTGLHVKTKWKRITILSCKYIFILYSLYTLTTQAIQGMRQYGENMPKPKLYGYYKVDTFVKNKDTIPPLLTDKNRWKDITVTEYMYCSVKKMNDSISYYSFQEDSVYHQLTLIERDSGLKHTFSYKILNNQLELKSNDGFEISYMKLTKMNTDDFPLMKRGFQWINEYPLNR